MSWVEELGGVNGVSAVWFVSGALSVRRRLVELPLVLVFLVGICEVFVVVVVVKVETFSYSQQIFTN